MKATTDQAIEFNEACFRHSFICRAEGKPFEANIVPFAVGQPGVGKTMATRTAIDRINQDHDFLSYLQKKLDFDGLIRCQETLLANYEPSDIGGLQWPHEGRSVRLRPNLLPKDGAGVLFLDEYTKAPKLSQSLSAQLIYTGRINEHALGRGWIISVASNRRQDRSGDTDPPSHMVDRTAYYEVVDDVHSWLAHAMRSGYDQRVIFFVKAFSTEHFNKYKEGQLKQPTPRSYEKVSEMLMGGQFRSDISLRCGLEGQLGEATGNQMYAFCKQRENVPDPEYILANPMSVKIPVKSQSQYIMMAALSGMVKRDTTPGLRDFLKRFDSEVSNGAELSAFVIQSVHARDKRILTTPAGVELVASYHDLLKGKL